MVQRSIYCCSDLEPLVLLELPESLKYVHKLQSQQNQTHTIRATSFLSQTKSCWKEVVY